MSRDTEGQVKLVLVITEEMHDRMLFLQEVTGDDLNKVLSKSVNLYAHAVEAAQNGLSVEGQQLAELAASSIDSSLSAGEVFSSDESDT